MLASKLHDDYYPVAFMVFENVALSLSLYAIGRMSIFDDMSELLFLY